MCAPLPSIFDDSLSDNAAAFQSWRSMKTWVMTWLWALNAVYWIGFYYLPRAEAIWAVVSYLAVVPIVSVMIREQRGLTRLTGLIHLPWVPYLAYLGLRLFTDMLGPSVASGGDNVYLIWLHVVFWSTLVCVALDVVDVVRWFTGERYVLGTPAAAAAGASKLAPVFKT